MFESKTPVFFLVVGSYDFRTGMISWRINKNNLPFFLKFRKLEILPLPRGCYLRTVVGSCGGRPFV